MKDKKNFSKNDEANTTFTFDYNLRILSDLRGAMNSNTFLAINKINKYQNKLNYQAWGCMCAAMDRLDDTMRYINKLVLGKSNYEAAFDFYDFINNVYVVIKSIQAMANIFDVDFSAIEKGNSSFNLKCSDSEWFKYVRSLCSVHPTETTGRCHKSIMQNEIFGCCARVDWDTCHMIGTGDLVAIIYNFPKETVEGENVPEYTHSYIPLYITNFKDYLQRWLDFIPTIIEAIHKYNDTKYEEFRKLPIKKLSDCKNDIERIAVLRKEYNRRYGDNIDEIFEFYLTVFQYHLSNEENRLLLEKYRSAIRLSLTFLYNALQNMSFDGYDNCGLTNDNSSFLFYELYYPDLYCLENLSGFGYHLSKIYLLYSRSIFEKERIRHLLDELKPVVNKYVNFTNTETEDETAILIQMAIYFDAMGSNCTLNKNIPNELIYRIKLLSEKEIDVLSKEETEEVPKDDLLKSLPKEIRDLF